MHIDPYIGVNRHLYLSNYTPKWRLLFEREKLKLQKTIECVCSIEHIGSTAVVNIMAKPTIDIAIGLGKGINIKILKQSFETKGYVYEDRLRKVLPNRHFFWAGTKENHTFHLHVVSRNGNDWKDMIYMRNYLNIAMDARIEYEKSKVESMKMCANNVGRYVKGKEITYKKLLKIAQNYNWPV